MHHSVGEGLNQDSGAVYYCVVFPHKSLILALYKRGLVAGYLDRASSSIVLKLSVKLIIERGISNYF